MTKQVERFLCGFAIKILYRLVLHEKENGIEWNMPFAQFI